MMTKEYLKFARDRLKRSKILLKKLSTISVKEDDEKELYRSFQDGVMEYEKLILAVLDDKKVTEMEMEQIQIIEKKILQDMRAKVLEDGEVSPEEESLLHEIIELFETMTKE